MQNQTLNSIRRYVQGLFMMVTLTIINPSLLVSQDLILLNNGWEEFIDDDDKPVIEGVPKYTQATLDRTTPELLELGFDHSKHTNFDYYKWQRLSPQNKINIAYLSAESASRGSGGRFLALLVKSLSQEYPAIKYEKWKLAKAEGQIKFKKINEVRLPSRFDRMKPTLDNERLSTVSDYLGSGNTYSKKSFGESKSAFDNYNSKNGLDKKNTVYKDLLDSKKVYGGIVFGNQVLTEKSYPKLNEIKIWPPVPEPSDMNVRLEFYFSDLSYGFFDKVDKEQLYAALRLLNDPNYEIGQGIGLVSLITDYDYEKSDEWKMKAMVNSYVSNLKLGWYLTYVDATMDDVGELSEDLQQEIEELNKSLNRSGDSIRLLKCTDRKMQVSATHGQMQVRAVGNSDELDSKRILSIYYVTKDKSDAILSPLDQTLLKKIEGKEEYYQSNQFAKILGLLRWGKSQQIKLPKFSFLPSFVNPPKNVFMSYDLGSDLWIMEKIESH